MGKIAFLFAGQGAQYVGMGKDLYENISVAKNIFDMGEELRPDTLVQCFDSDKETLSLTKNTQPCLFLNDLACAKVLESKGVKPDMVAGFSLGEIAALAYAQVLSDEEAFKLVTIRGEVMAKCAIANPGGMVAVVRLSNEQVDMAAEKYTNVYPVNYNCPGQVSVAGNSEELTLYSKDIKELGGRAIPLKVSGAFHTPFMKEASEVLTDTLKSMEVSRPNVTLYSNMTGYVYPTNKDEIIETIAMQASSSVKWETIIRKMYEDGCDTFIEVGAGKTLSGFIQKTLSDVTVLNVADMESLKATLEAFGK